MKKALMVANTASMIKQFNLKNICLLQELGYSVDVIANFSNGNTMPIELVENFSYELKEMGVNYFNTPIARNPYDIKGIIRSYKKIRKICKENKYSIVHCQSPIGAAVTRFAAQKCRKKYKTKIVYTAHGFHFFRGAPLKNWMLYFPIEFVASFFTDVLVTINIEDFKLAKKVMKAREIKYIPGAGVDLKKHKKMLLDVDKLKMELGIPKDKIIMLSVGELNINKNHEMIIRVLKELNHDNIFYVICGEGKRKKEIINLAEELGVLDRVLILGYREDIEIINNCCDFFVFPSLREGLGLAALEAMASGLPVVGTKIHGIPDYLKDGVNGFLCKKLNVDDFTNKVNTLIENKALRRKMGENAALSVKKFDIENVNMEMRKIYAGLGNKVKETDFAKI